MEAPAESKPLTFSADRSRYAHEQTGRLMAALRPHIKAILLTLLAVSIGVAFFGSSYITENARGTTVTVLTGLTACALAALGWLAVYFFNYLIAPSRLWQRDRGEIARLEERLRPKGRMRFAPPDCVRSVPIGHVGVAENGKRWLTETNRSRQIFVICESHSSVHCESAQIDVVRILKNGRPHPLFFQPITLLGGFSIRPEVPIFAPVLVHDNRFERPYVAAQLPYGYNLLFEEQGEYQLDLVLHAPDMPSDKLSIGFHLSMDEKGSGNGLIKDYDLVNLYEIASASQ